MTSPAAEPRVFRLLVADDNQVNRRLIELLVERRGWTAQAVDNGQAAVDAWRHGSFDLVLMDVRMPKMDGLEATRRIRAEEAGSGRRVPILALTANSGEQDLADCLAAGMDGMVSKPMHYADFYRACLAALGENH